MQKEVAEKCSKLLYIIRENEDSLKVLYRQKESIDSKIKNCKEELSKASKELEEL